MKHLIWLCLALASASAQAQTVYRCGIDGRVYSQSPCEQGGGRQVNVSDERNAQQRDDAEARVRNEQALGQALERERLDRAASQPAAATASLTVRPVQTEAEPKPKKAKKKADTPGNSEDFKAVAPSTKAKRSAA